ncbi:uncharacterized protein LOC131676689 isoform X2 [Topomyia yanbarensis]|uniref:uncharacterized protein LOC131676689 isoform X2 n=1 Tax=Topomyia yanbarensis TaxID=2498891 RepID=UPI00273C2215|nr:uncharacterized protein LOC131676689 isoform X2 [Topomyia yanbarensis]
MILSGDLVFRVHFVVVLLQSVCITTVASAAATVTVSTATKTSSTTNTTTTGNGIIGGAGPPSYNSSCGDSIPAVPDSPRVPDSRAYYDKLRPVIAMQKYHLFGELGQTCSATEDCRQYAYECGDRKQICECAKGYRPDEDRRTCVGAIGKRCQYDAHCITNAYCKGQMICTCKREYEYHSEDKWSCQVFYYSWRSGYIGVKVQKYRSMQHIQTNERTETNSKGTHRRGHRTRKRQRQTRCCCCYDSAGQCHRSRRI